MKQISVGCEALLEVSQGRGNRCRRWARKIQCNSYRKRTSVIIPENDYNWGWEDIAGKIKIFLGMAVNPRFQLADSKAKSYFQAAKITNWPTNSEKSSQSQSIEKENFPAKWQISAGRRVTPINHNKFIFKLHPKQEAIRVKNGDWFWNGRRLTLNWWLAAAESEVTHRDAGQRWVKVFGNPLHAWTTENFRKIGNQCGRYVDIDEDTENRNQLYWARICVHSDMEFPRKVDLAVKEWKFEISIISDSDVVAGKVKHEGSLPSRPRNAPLLGLL
ncbi:hypothetical protein KY290_001055 [Solanum tuberosum]|uniref:DUF4283 domain-containing protein n=1 Tax=Solanum tuberosum TaxID=4113 RepID=A0ABQ7WNA9_SOLTU|nr:hypothetical protein KY290_001055 [Solanum tuberosum]